MDRNITAKGMGMVCATPAITPDDVKSSDTVAFVLKSE